MLDNHGGKAELQLVVRLYIAGRAPNSVRAVNNLQLMVDEDGEISWQIEVVDVLVEPLRALADGVLVTPTLIRVAPEPEVWIVGDLSQEEEVRGALGVQMSPKTDSKLSKAFR